MNLLICGLPQKGAQARIRAAAAAFAIDVCSESLGDARKSDAWDTEAWDILIAGLDANTKGVPELIERLSRDHPAGLIIVVERGDNAAFREACLKAGALEILPSDVSRQDVELALGRAATLIHRFHRRVHDEKLRGINQLAVSVNHEINNPLMGLMGTAEMILMENQDLPQKVRRDLKTVIDQARRIQSITLRLRDLNHLRTIPYDDRASMIDLLGAAEESTESAAALSIPAARSKPEHETPVPPEVFGSARMLVVDDNTLIIDLIHRLLDERFDIDHAVRPSEALRKVKDTEYDVILIDLMLPEMDGLDLYRAMERIRPGQRVIIATGYDSDPRIGKAIQEGVHSWIQKPFKFENLEDMIQGALKGSKPMARQGH